MRHSRSTLGILTPLVVFAGIASQITKPNPLLVDVPVLNFLHGIADPQINALAVALTWLGGPIFITLITLLFALFFVRHKNPWAARMIAFTAIGATVIDALLKLAFQRARPDLWESVITADWYSFPSGHAMSSSALAFSLMIIFWKTRWRWLAVGVGSIYIIMVGLTRVYLGVHFPSDVLAGWCLGLSWALLMRSIWLRCNG